MRDKTQTELFFQHSNELFCVTEFDGTILQVNPAWKPALGLEPHELVSKSIFDFIDPEDVSQMEQYFDNIRDKTHSGNLQNHFLSKDGTYHWLSWNVYPDYNEKLIYVIARDINLQKAKESKFKQLADIVEHSNDAIISHTAMGYILSWNRGAERTYGYTHNEMIGKSITQILPNDRKHETKNIIEQIKNKVEIEQFETVHQCKNNQLINMSLSYSPIFSSTKKLLAVSCIGRDITKQKQIWQELQKHREELDQLVEQRTQELSETNNKLHQEIQERKRVEEQLRLLANNDALTGLLNRRRFLELLEQEFTRSKRYGLSLPLLVIDLDFFKRINDTYGHAFGDETLQAFAQTGSQLFRSVDVLGRTGGEEFAVFLPETPLKGAQEAAERFRSAIEKMVLESGGQSIQITISIGIALLEESTPSIQDLFSNADLALYEAKRTGRNRWVVYDPKQNEQIQQITP